MTHLVADIVRRLHATAEPFVQDLRHAMRHLRRSPGPAAAMVAILSLVMTAGATLAAVTNAIVFRALPVADPHRLAAVSMTDSEAGGVRLFHYETFRQFVEQQSMLDGAFAFRGGGLLDLRYRDTESQGLIAAVTPGFFETLGLTPAAGRFYTSQDAPATGEPARVVVLAYRTWQRLCGGSADAIGDTLVVSGQPLTVIGVMAQSFPGLEPHGGSDFYVPTTLLPHLLEQAPAASPNPRISHVVGRLRDGVTIDQARAAVSAIWPAIVDATSPSPNAARRGATTDVVLVESASAGFSSLRTRVGQPLMMLTGLAVALVLIGCVNLGGLMHARSIARQGQIAMLAALGAPLFRLVRVLVLEASLLAAAVSVVVLPFVHALSAATGPLLWQGSRPLLLRLEPDWTAGAAIAAVTLLACLAVNVLPALSSIRMASRVNLRAQRSVTAGRRSVAGAFIVAQVTLSVVLVTTAGLFAGSLTQLQSLHTGFRSSDLVFGRAWQLPGPRRTYDEQSHYPALVERLEALPGVTSVALSQYFPGYLGFNGFTLDAIGRVEASDRSADVDSLVEYVSPRFFETAGASIVRGRDVTWADHAGAAPVVVINETLARRLFPDGDAVGARVRVGDAPDRQSVEVVGVSSDITVGNLRSPHLPTAFRPRMQEPDRLRVPILLLATTRDAESLFDQVDATVRSMGHERLRTLHTIEAQLDDTLQNERLLALTSSAFGVTAALVTLVGLYALLAHMVTMRRREIGLRVAIGASSAHVVGIVAGRAVGLTMAGVALGVPAALGAGRLAESLLFGIRPADPLVIAAAALAFVSIAALAAFLPARRAARIDPAVALRE